MRSVFVFSSSANRPQVEKHLADRFGPPRDGCWSDLHSVWARFIEFRGEFDPDDLAAISSAVRAEEMICVMADISGRIPGVREATEFAVLLLEEVPSVALDDYSAHPWTLEELRSGARCDDHTFFDTDGWYEERQKAAQPGATDNPGDAQ